MAASGEPASPAGSAHGVAVRPNGRGAARPAPQARYQVNLGLSGDHLEKPQVSNVAEKDR